LKKFNFQNEENITKKSTYANIHNSPSNDSKKLYALNVNNNSIPKNKDVQKESATDCVLNTRNILNTEEIKSKKSTNINMNNHSKKSVLIQNNLNINNLINANPKKKNSMPSNMESKVMNYNNCKQQIKLGNPASRNNSNGMNQNNNLQKNISQGKHIDIKKIDNKQKNNSKYTNNLKHNSNKLINRKNNKDNNELINTHENLDKICNMISMGSIHKIRNNVCSVSHSPRNRKNSYNNNQAINVFQNLEKEKELNALININKNKFKEYDKIIQNQINLVMINNNNMINQKPKELTDKKKIYKHHSTDNNANKKIGNKKFPLFNHNGVFKIKVKSNKKRAKIDTLNKLKIENKTDDNETNKSNTSVENEDNDNEKNSNLNILYMNHKMNNNYNNDKNKDDNATLLNIYKNLDKSLDNAEIKTPIAKNDFIGNFIDRKQVSSYKKEKIDLNNIFLNNLEINSKSNAKLANKETSIDKINFDNSEIFSTYNDKNQDNSKLHSTLGNEKFSNKKLKNLYNNNIFNDDLTLILSPKGIEGNYSGSNFYNLELKSSLFFDKNNQNSLCSEILNTNLIRNDYKIDKNKINNTSDHQENILTNMNSNVLNSQTNIRLNNINVQKFINKGGNISKYNNLQSVNSTNSNIDSNLNINTNLKILQSNSFNQKDFIASKFINVPNNNTNTNENIRNLSNENIKKDHFTNFNEQITNLSPNNEMVKDNFMNSSHKYKFLESNLNNCKKNLINNSVDNSNSRDFKDLDSKTRAKNNFNCLNDFDLKEKFTKNFNLNNFKINPSNCKDFSENSCDIGEKEIKNFIENSSKYKKNSNDFKSKFENDFLRKANSECFDTENTNTNIITERKHINLLKMARLEKQKHKKSGSLNQKELESNNKIKYHNSNTADSKANRNNTYDIFSSGKLEIKGFNKNTVDFIYKYQRNKESRSNSKSKSVDESSKNFNFFGLNNIDNPNKLRNIQYNENEKNQYNSNLTNDCNQINANKNNEISFNNVLNINKFGRNFSSENFNDRKNFNSHLINNKYNINNLHLRNSSGTNNEDLSLDVVDEVTLDIVEETKMTIEEELQRNVVNSKNPKLINSLEKK